MNKPNFICGGAPKCGTTTLFQMLSTHPNIFIPELKEPHFFSSEKNYSKGFEWYINTHYSNIQNQKVVADFSPSYLHTKDACVRIEKDLGKKVKFLFILRHPVDRAYSHYIHNKRDLLEERNFECAIYESKKFDSVADPNLRKLNYVKISRYTQHIKRFISVFGEENVKVLIFERFVKNEGTYLNEIYDYLGLPSIDHDMNKNIKSNSAKRIRFKFIKKVMSVRLLRYLSKEIIGEKNALKVKRRITKLNLKHYEKKNLDSKLRSELVNKFFIQDIKDLENLLSDRLKEWY